MYAANVAFTICKGFITKSFFLKAVVLVAVPHDGFFLFVRKV